jgi:hypothetical protein
VRTVERIDQDQMDRLTVAIEGLSANARAVKRASDRQSALATGVAVFLAIGLVWLSVTAFDSARQIDESNRRWCPMVALLIPAPGDPPPTTPRGIQLVAQARTLSESFGCPTPPHQLPTSSPGGLK